MGHVLLDVRGPLGGKEEGRLREPHSSFFQKWLLPGVEALQEHNSGPVLQNFLSPVLPPRQQIELTLFFMTLLGHRLELRPFPSTCT